jgi:signal transduction histidine kinase
VGEEVRGVGHRTCGNNLSANASRGSSLGQNESFARFVSLACHDLRTPLATVHGFARTLIRTEGVGEPMSRYLAIMEEASAQIGDLLEDLAVAARIEGGRYEPALREADTLDLARAAGERLDGRVEVRGEGGTVTVEPDAAERSVYNLARCAIRHGGLERLVLIADGPELSFAPITPEATPIVLAEDVRDLGSATARRVIEALGGSLELDGERLVVSLPAAAT